MTRSTQTVARARRGLALFAVLAILGSAAVDMNIARRPSWIFALMWVPGLSALITRALLREGFSDLSLRLDRRGLRWLGVAWLHPVVTLSAAYGVAWMSGLEALQAGTSSGDVARSLARSATLGLLPSTLSAAGEELGWRGYMLPRLIEARVPHPVAVSGVVWWAWHLPLVLTGQLVTGPSPFIAALLFLPSVMALAFVAALLQRKTGSVWPAVMLHASVNAVMDLTFDPLTVSRPGGPLWTGASGLLVGAVWSASAMLLWRMARSR